KANGQSKSRPIARTAFNDCLPYENSYFCVVVSPLFIFVVSPLMLVVSCTGGATSVFSIVVVSSVVVVSDSLLQATNPRLATARTKKSFFIVVIFFKKRNISRFIPESGKGNPGF